VVVIVDTYQVFTKVYARFKNAGAFFENTRGWLSERAPNKYLIYSNYV